ncbi:MAG: CapA family protein [Deltaproteobacteria bacterium]|nr:CapA family protein [Deltaproteobacteria bacterium]
MRWACVLLVAGCAARPGGETRGAALWFGGDVHLGARGEGVLAALPGLTGGEPVVVNLEGPVGDGAASAAPERLVNAVGVPALLAKAGVRVAGVENNHALDIGEAGREATKQALNAAGVTPSGPVRRTVWPARPPTDGQQGAGGGGSLLELAEAPPSHAETALLRVGALPLAVVSIDLARGIPAHHVFELRAALPPSGALVVAFHVTGPLSYLPTGELELAVEFALQAGATVIVAHGTHAPARVERRGRAVIAWGLGNLAFDCPCTDERDGLLLRVELAADGAVTRATVVPVDAGLHGAPLRPAANAGLALDLLESLESSPLRRSTDRADF